MRLGAGAAAARCGRRSSPGRTTSIRTCRRTTRSASTTCRSTSTASSTCPTARGSASSGPTSRRTPASPPTSAASGRIHDADYSLVDYNRAGVPLRRDREPARHPLGRRRPGPTSTELRAILVATGVVRRPMEEGSLRVDANVSVRPAGDDALGTRCEIKNLNSLRSLGRAIEYEARRQVDLLEAGERVVPGDPPLERGRRAAPHRCARRRRPYDYRYFPEPDLVPLDPDDDVGRPGRRRAARAARRPPGRAGRGGRRAPPTPRWPSSSSAGLDDLALGGHRGRRRPGRVLDPRRATTWPVDGAADARRRPPSPRSSRMETGGALTATQAKQVLAELVADGRRPGGHRRRPRASRPWTPTRWRRWSTRSSPPTPTSGSGSSDGDDKAGTRLLRRPGHEGHQGPGRRQGGHRPPAPARRARRRTQFA